MPRVRARAERGASRARRRHVIAGGLLEPAFGLEAGARLGELPRGCARDRPRAAASRSGTWWRAAPRRSRPRPRGGTRTPPSARLRRSARGARCARPPRRSPRATPRSAASAAPGPTTTKAGSAKTTPSTPPSAANCAMRRSPGISSIAKPEPSSRQPGSTENRKPGSPCAGARHSQKRPASNGIQASRGQRTSDDTRRSMGSPGSAAAANREARRYRGARRAATGR